MQFKGTILAATALVAMSTVSAMAADLGGMKGGSIKDGGYAEPARSFSPSAFYLRGDYSWASQSLGSMHEPPAYTLSDVSIANTWGWGLGAGYYVTKNVRADVTFDWRQSADVRGSVIDGAATIQGERQFGVKSQVTLFNLYYDFDMRSHFTPYIGVGLGFSRNTTSGGTIVPSCTVACTAEFDGAKQWSTAAALMAGFSAKLHDRLSLDAGYRFLYMGDAHTGDIRVTTVGCTGPCASPDPKLSDLSAHEFRVGMRWDIK